MRNIPDKRRNLRFSFLPLKIPLCVQLSIDFNTNTDINSNTDINTNTNTNTYTITNSNTNSGGCLQ